MPSRLRVLLIEDSPDDALLIERLLRQGGFELETERVDSEPALRVALERTAWDLILADYNLPGFSGRAALDLVRARGLEMPVIFVSGSIGEDVAVAAMKAGANDYVMKGNLRRLVPAVERELREAAERAERRRTEVALRQSEERFARAFDASPVGIAISTLSEGRYLDVNPALVELLGWPREEMLGRTSKELGIWKDWTNRNQMLADLRRRGALRNLDVPLRTRAGEVRSTLCNFERIDLEGEPCLLSLVLDLTERQRLEEQLRHSQRLEAIGRLAGGVAHDFNNLLTVILGSCDLLAAKIPPGIPEIGAIRQASEGAAALTRQLLAFGRKQVLQPRRLDLSEVAQRARRLLDRLLGAQIEIGTVLAPAGTAIVRADPGQLEQVLVNLAVNAGDAMPEGGRLRLLTGVRTISETEAAVGERSGRYAVLGVEDSGSGMDEQVRAHLFEPFFTTKEPGKGSGLGLATVHGIVAQSGGFLRVASAPGAGSTFEVFLPWVEGAAEPAAGAAPSAESPSSGHETILLVEDSDPVRAVASRMLAKHGYRLLEAADGEAALRLAADHEGPIALLLTDLVLPGITGRALADRLAVARPGLKILYTSGYSSDAALRDGLIAGGFSYLEKPFTGAQLAGKVRQVLDGD
jgi:PAS domain S-box-containing protein